MKDQRIIDYIDKHNQLHVVGTHKRIDYIIKIIQKSCDYDLKIHDCSVKLTKHNNYELVKIISKGTDKGPDVIKNVIVYDRYMNIYLDVPILVKSSIIYPGSNNLYIPIFDTATVPVEKLIMVRNVLVRLQNCNTTDIFLTDIHNGNFSCKTNDITTNWSKLTKAVKWITKDIYDSSLLFHKEDMDFICETDSHYSRGCTICYGTVPSNKMYLLPVFDTYPLIIKLNVMVDDRSITYALACKTDKTAEISVTHFTQGINNLISFHEKNKIMTTNVLPYIEWLYDLSLDTNIPLFDYDPKDYANELLYNIDISDEMKNTYYTKIKNYLSNTVNIITSYK